jgi:hypothetical protein
MRHTLQLFVESKEELRKRQAPSGVSMCVHWGGGECGKSAWLSARGLAGVSTGDERVGGKPLGKL